MNNIHRKHYFRLLSKKEQTVYSEIQAGLMALKSEIALSAPLTISNERCMELLQFVLLDHPILFFLDTKRIELHHNSQIAKLNVRFLYPEKKIREMLSSMKSNCERILTSITRPGMSDLAKLYAVHDYLRDRVGYSTQSSDAHSIAGVLLRGKAVCEGIAKVCKLLCDELAIECIVVTGSAQDASGQNRTVSGPMSTGEIGHAWNIVCINGHYQHLDITWDNTLKASTGFARYDYFCLSDSSIVVDHKWDRKQTPSCVVEPDNHFVTRQLTVNSKFAMRQLIGSQIRGGLKEIVVRIRLESSIGLHYNRYFRSCMEELHKGFGFEYCENERLRILYARLI